MDINNQAWALPVYGTGGALPAGVKFDMPEFALNPQQQLSLPDNNVLPGDFTQNTFKLSDDLFAGYLSFIDSNKASSYSGQDVVNAALKDAGFDPNNVPKYETTSEGTVSNVSLQNMEKLMNEQISNINQNASTLTPLLSQKKAITDDMSLREKAENGCKVSQDLIKGVESGRLDQDKFTRLYMDHLEINRLKEQYTDRNGNISPENQKKLDQKTESFNNLFDFYWRDSRVKVGIATNTDVRKEQYAQATEAYQSLLA